MVYQERNTWSSLIAGVLSVAVYIVLVLQAAATRPIETVDWFPLMAWTIAGAIAGAILLSIAWGIVAGMADRDGMGRTDERDREIFVLGERVGQAFLVLGGVGALVLCGIEAPLFWIAQTLFFGFVLSSVVGGIARVIAYRRGVV